MRRKPIIPMMRLKSSFDLKKLIYDNTPYGLCSFAEVIGVNPMTLVKLSKHLPVRVCTTQPCTAISRASISRCPLVKRLS